MHGSEAEKRLFRQSGDGRDVGGGVADVRYGTVRMGACLGVIGGDDGELCTR